MAAKVHVKIHKLFGVVIKLCSFIVATSMSSLRLILINRYQLKVHEVMNFVFVLSNALQFVAKNLLSLSEFTVADDETRVCCFVADFQFQLKLCNFQNTSRCRQRERFIQNLRRICDDAISLLGENL